MGKRQRKKKPRAKQQQSIQHAQPSEPWTWELVCVVVLGLPLYAGSYFGFGLMVAFLFHVAVTFIYALSLLYFGRGSVIEMGVVAFILSFLIAILLPVFQRAAQHRAKSSRVSQLLFQAVR